MALLFERRFRASRVGRNGVHIRRRIVGRRGSDGFVGLLGCPWVGCLVWLEQTSLRMVANNRRILLDTTESKLECNDQDFNSYKRNLTSKLYATMAEWFPFITLNAADS